MRLHVIFSMCFVLCTSVTYHIAAAILWILYNYHVQVYGVKGPCCLATVPSFDIIDGTSANYMHCVMLGVTRMLLRLWFNSTFHSEVWYIGTTVKVIDSRLSCIKPPYEIQRIPRCIEKTVNYWKGKCH